MSEDYDIALRPDELHPDEMDDIVVRNVSLFRAEAMSDKSWWMSCFLADGQEVVFWITIKKKRIVVLCTDQPGHGYVYEDDEMRAKARAEVDRRAAAAKASDNDGEVT